MQQVLFPVAESNSQNTTPVKKRLTVIGVPSLTPAAPEKIGSYPLNTVQVLDCVAGMKCLPDQSVDVAVADPPYNLSQGGVWKWDNSVKLPGFGGDWAKVMEGWDNMPLADYFSFTLQWLAELKRVVRPTGSLWIHGTYHNIGIINFALQLLGIEIINEVVWYKRNSFPNLSGRRLTASHETILWAHTGKKRQYYFDYEAAKSTAFPEDALKAPGKQMRTVWDVPNNKEREEIRSGKHPTQKPLRLLQRMLSISSQAGQTCLVPFAGAGSECVAARRCGLNFIAFENDPEYAKICDLRLNTMPPTLTFADTNNQGANGVQQPKIAGVSNRSAIKKPVQNIPSLIKWTGCKRSQAHVISSYIPDHRHYFEPFVGSGAILFLMARPGAVAGDIYEPLIELWRLVQSDPLALIMNYRNQWTLLHERLPEYFYEVRDRFNAGANPFDLNFLLRTCVNGIVRFNDAGAFNNSFHLSRPGMHPDRFSSVVTEWHEAIKPVNFACQDYAETISEARAGDFVYLDPPYLGNKQRYTRNIDINRFFTVLEEMNRREVKWALSFDGSRGGRDLSCPIPQGLYKRRILIESGNSAVGKVLNGPVEMVKESLYMNY